jgi:DNA-binding response OmpR family regulator
MHLLLVEDEPDLGYAIQSALLRRNYVVDWVQDGELAWDCLHRLSHNYTIAIVDWMLPKLSGLEICQRLRSHQNPLPVMMLTAKDSLSDRVIGLDAGADDYLVKPFGMEELLARVRALQRRSPTFQPPQLQVGQLMLDYTIVIRFGRANGDVIDWGSGLDIGRIGNQTNPEILSTNSTIYSGCCP